MGLLPDVAEGVDIDIPTAGHVISLYALGVVVGAPVLAALGTRLPRRGLLIGLMVAFVVGNALTAVAPRELTKEWLLPCLPGRFACVMRAWGLRARPGRAWNADGG